MARTAPLKDVLIRMERANAKVLAEIARKKREGLTLTARLADLTRANAEVLAKIAYKKALDI